MGQLFISGGSSGLGLRLTVDSLLANEGVTATYQTHPAPLHFLQKRFKSLNAIALDLAQPSPSEDWPEVIDSAILCAGSIKNQLMLKETSDDFADHLKAHLTGNMTLCRALYPRLRKSKNPHLVIVSSRSAYEGNVGQAAYSASRAGLVGFGKTLAREWARAGIKVNIIFPGWMKTRQTIAMPDKIRSDFEAQNVLGHTNTLAEISRFIRFLITTQHISGQIFNLDSRINTN